MPTSLIICDHAPWRAFERHPRHVRPVMVVKFGRRPASASRNA